MIDVAVNGTAMMRMTTKMIAEQALARGWKVELYYAEGSQMRITRNDGVAIELYSASTPDVSHTWTNRAGDKYFTNIYLASQGLPVAETYLVSVHDEQAARIAAEKLFSAGKQAVVKPLDAGHGDGITVGVATEAQLHTALQYAAVHSKKAIIQEYFAAPVDVRLTCINYKAQAALVRMPARVQGDGVHSVAELIEHANSNGSRGKGYTSRLTAISVEGAQVFLGDEGLVRVPQAGEWVQVVGTANVGTGGETVDVTDRIPLWLKQQAERAARAMHLPVCGVDFLLAAMPEQDASPDDLQPVIIELNQNPSLFIHEAPIHGTSRPVVSAFLDYVATLDEGVTMASEDKELQIIGRAEQIDFPTIGAEGVFARIDTGARTSAIWASEVREEDGRLAVVFFGEGCPGYTGKTYYFDDFEQIIVASSNGHAQERYKISLSVRIGGRRIRSYFTLADRASQVYPVLIGRNTLRGKFIVDVKQGTALREEEKRRTEALQAQVRKGKE